MESIFGNVDNYRILIRDKKGCFLLHPFKSKTEKEFTLEQCSSIIPSKKYFAIINQGKLSIYLTKDCSLIKEFPDLTQVFAVNFSPTENYLTTIQKPVVEKNLKVFNINENFSLLQEFRSHVHPNNEWPQITFSKDEKFIFFHNKTSVEIYDENKNLVQKLENLVAFEDFLPPEGGHYLVGGEVEIQKNSEGAGGNKNKKGKETKKCYLTTYDFKDLTKPVKRLNTSFIDRAILKKSLDEKYLLVNTINDNTTKDSYYGQSSLYFYEVSTNRFIKFPLPEGPIHDFCWCGDGEHFIIVAGHLPSTAYFYNKDGTLNRQIAKGNFNTIKISPDNRFVALCGFGSLKGDIEIYSLKDFKIIGIYNFFCCVNFEWSQDSKYLLGAVLSTRVKVDNEYRILKYNGEEVVVDKNVGEIYDCVFLYEEDENKIKYDEFDIEINKKSLEQKKKETKSFSTLGALDFTHSSNKPPIDDGGIVGLGPKKKKKKKNQNLP